MRKNVTIDWAGSYMFTGAYEIYEFDLGAINDNVKRVVGDEDTTSFSATGWFSAVQTPSWSVPSRKHDWPDRWQTDTRLPLDEARFCRAFCMQTIHFLSDGAVQ